MVAIEYNLEGRVKKPQEDIEEDFEHKGLVGTGEIRLEKGKSIVVSPDGVYRFKGINRSPVLRELWMIEENQKHRMWRDRFATASRRILTGENMILDKYEATSDNSCLGISSNVIGSDLQAVSLEQGPIIARRGVYFGNERNVRFEASTPLSNLRNGKNLSDIFETLKKSSYGPGLILQRFSSLGDEENQVIFNFDGDWEMHSLKRGEESEQIDPRHLYAWDESVSFSLKPFGHMVDVLLRGELRYYVTMKGPGRFWLSNLGYGDGYVGNLVTPAYWLHKSASLVGKAAGFLNPLNWGSK